MDAGQKTLRQFPLHRVDRATSPVYQKHLSPCGLRAAEIVAPSRRHRGDFLQEGPPPTGAEAQGVAILPNDFGAGGAVAEQDEPLVPKIAQLVVDRDAMQFRKLNKSRRQ